MNNSIESGQRSTKPTGPRLWEVAVVFAVVLLVLFNKVLLPGFTVFSNDGPLGTLVQDCRRMPDILTGGWQDLNSLGFRGGDALPSISYGFLYLLGPVGFAKFDVLLALSILGLSAWYCFRQLGLSPWACLLGGLAAMLNSGYFSASCWGVATHAITVGMSFLALGLTADTSSRRRWFALPLAGLSIGMGVSEGADIGAIFSLYVALYVLYRSISSAGLKAAGLVSGVTRVAVIALFAALLAAQTIDVLISTQIQGVAGTQQDSRTKQERWDWATQWSLPKREALGIVVPGLFGYRMDAPQGLPNYLQEHFVGGNYWGAAGRDPNWDRYFRAAGGGALQSGNLIAVTFPDSPSLNVTQLVGSDGKIALPKIGGVRAGGLTLTELEAELTKLYSQAGAAAQLKVAVQPPQGLMRYSGGGEYAGLLVVLVGFWAAVQACRSRHSAFSLEQRKQLWFWVGTALIALLLAFGRHAPFYQFLYALPYFSTIRNPAKFLHVFSFALIILFAYGVDVLSRRHSETVAATLGNGFRSWLAKAQAFDRRWVLGCAVTFAVCVVSWLLYASHRADLERYLQTVQFPEGMAHEIAGFSINQAGWFLLFLAAGLVLFIAALSGRFVGPRANWGGILFSLFMLIDLGRANLPWIIFVDYEAKNAPNPVIDLLRQQPYEHRTAILPFRAPSQQYAILDDLYRIQWAQHQFQYYNIQSLDAVQMPRAPEDLVAFESALGFDQSTNTLHRVARRWQLTNTRYLLGAAGFLDVLNQQLDPLRHRFRIAARFNIGLKPGVSTYRQETDLTVAITPDGPFAVFDYTAALPRAKLYSRWQVSTNDQATLGTLASQQFDPEQSVLVDTPIPASTASTNAGNVSFFSYAPKNIKFKAEAAGPSVLLLNDRFDPNWKVFVDGKQEPLLRCNFIMRGVQVPSGQHQVEFRFEPPVRALYVSVAAVFVGLALVGCLLFVKEPTAPELRPQPAPAREKARA